VSVSVARGRGRSRFFRLQPHQQQQPPHLTHNQARFIHSSQPCAQRHSLTLHAAASVTPSSSTDSLPSLYDSSNPLLAPCVTPLFSKITPKHIRNGCKWIHARLKTHFEALEARLSAALDEHGNEHGNAAHSSAHALSWESVIEPLEMIMDRFNFVWGVISHLSSVRDSPELRRVVAEVEPLRLSLSLSFAQSLPLYRALTSLAEDDAAAARSKLSAAQQKIVSDLLLDARLGGVALEGKAKERFNILSQRLAQLSQQFGERVLDATSGAGLTVTEKEVMEAIPIQARTMYAQHARTSDPKIPNATAEEGPWRIGLSHAHTEPFMRFCTSRAHRQLLYRAYASRASQWDGFDNSPLVAEIVVLRRCIARMLGFDTYAHMSLASKLVKKPEDVHAFLDELRGKARGVAEKEMAELEAFARSDTTAPLPAGQRLRQWDMPFYSTRLAKHLHDLDPESLRPFFPLPRVLDGMGALLDTLYDIRLERRDASSVGPGKAIDTWHEDVLYFDVKARGQDEDGKDQVIAGIFMDLYSRPQEKRGGAWMGECVGRAVVRDPATGNTTTRLPVAYLICNQAPPTDPSHPSLMSHDEVVTMLHECGHAMQHVLTRVDHSLAAGIRGVAWDGVELASQFLESFASTPATLRQLSRHVDTDQPIPDDVCRKLAAQRKFRAGTALLRQIHLSTLDIALHGREADEALKQARVNVVTEDLINTDETTDASSSSTSSLPSQSPSSSGSASSTSCVAISPSHLSSLQSSLLSLERSVFSSHSLLDWDPQSRLPNIFLHLFSGGYAAGYYSYKWSECMSADAFEPFEQEEMRVEQEMAKAKAKVQNPSPTASSESNAAESSNASASSLPSSAFPSGWRALGLRFRDTVLALGGSMDAADVFRQFKGRDPTTGPLLRQAGLEGGNEQKQEANARK